MICSRVPFGAFNCMSATEKPQKQGVQRFDIGLRVCAETLIAEQSSGSVRELIGAQPGIQQREPLVVIGFTRLPFTERENHQPFEQFVALVQIVGRTHGSSEIVGVEPLVEASCVAHGTLPSHPLQDPADQQR